MKTAKPDPGQRAKCVGWKTGAETAVRHPVRINRSRDDYALPIQPGHRPTQRHRSQTALPEA